MKAVILIFLADGGRVVDLVPAQTRGEALAKAWRRNMVRAILLGWR